MDSLKLFNAFFFNEIIIASRKVETQTLKIGGTDKMVERYFDRHSSSMVNHVQPDHDADITVTFFDTLNFFPFKGLSINVPLNFEQFLIPIVTFFSTKALVMTSLNS